MARDCGQTAVGLIAGAGQFPFLVAEGARREGKRVVVVALRGFADPGLRPLADRFYWAGLLRVGRWIRCMRREGVRSAILAGGVRKSEMYSRFRLLRYVPDWTAIRIWFFRAADKRNDTLLGTLADLMREKGIELVDSVQYCPEAMAPEGVLTKGGPTGMAARDVEFGWGIAKEIGRLDIGQSVAVKEQEIIAVEAIEGTDRMIERAGALCRRGGWILIKVAKPNQDMRFDVPTIGPDTIENLNKHGARGLVVEAGKTLIVERENVIELADRYGIFVVGRAVGPA